MSEKEIFEQLANEYASEYNRTHGGNFNPALIKEYFLKGAYNKPLDDNNFHYFIAWKRGQVHGGYQFA